MTRNVLKIVGNFGAFLKKLTNDDVDYYSKTVNIPYFWHVSRLRRADPLRTVDD